MRSGQVAQAVGINRQTLRYYERRGLLTAPERTIGGHRDYPAQTVTLLRVIKAAQRLGFTLDEVADLLTIGTHRHRRNRRNQPGEGLQDRARDKLVEVEAKIADLQLIGDRLRAALDAGCDDLITCADSPHCPLPFADLADGSGARPSGSDAR